jgi:hypothetical protein
LAAARSFPRSDSPLCAVDDLCVSTASRAERCCRAYERACRACERVRFVGVFVAVMAIAALLVPTIVSEPRARHFKKNKKKQNKCRRCRAAICAV